MKMEFRKKSITPKNYIVFTIFMIIITLIVNISILTISSSIKNSKTDFKEISYLYEIEILKEEKIIDNTFKKIIFQSKDLINTNIAYGNLGFESLIRKFKNIFQSNSCYNRDLKVYKINNGSCRIVFQKEILLLSFENHFKTYFEKINKINNLNNLVLKYKLLKTNNNEFKIVRFSKIENFHFEKEIYLELDFNYITNLLFDIIQILNSQKFENEKLIEILNQKIENNNFVFENNKGDIIELYFKKYLIFSFLNSY